MSKNGQGPGTENFTVNLLKEEKQILGRLAVADGRSLGDFLRRLAVTALRITNPDAAQAIDEARRKHHEQLMLKI